MKARRADVGELVGVELASVVGMVVGSDEVRFTAKDGRQWIMYHSQDCCESVEITDVCGEPEDLVGGPITQAEEASNQPADMVPLPPYESREHHNESHTWTFYRIATAKGLVVLRWLGESNGYYSERVEFEQIN